MMKLPRVLDLRNRRSCNIIVPNRRPLFPIFLAPGALNGANTVIVTTESNETKFFSLIAKSIVTNLYNQDTCIILVLF